MMSAKMTYQGRTYKSVTVTGGSPDTEREAIVDIALLVARETRSSTFGTYVTSEHGDAGLVYYVTIHTD